MNEERRPVLVVGPSAYFLSGVSYQTAILARHLAEKTPLSLLLIRRLCPERAYPARDRIGLHGDEVLDLPDVPTVRDLDWNWRGLGRSLRFIRRTRPRALLLQYWTATQLHTYLALASWAKLHGADVVVEYHETLDTGEAKIPGVVPYARALGALLARLSSAGVVHSSFDLEAVRAFFRIPAGVSLQVIPLPARKVDLPEPRAQTSDALQLLFFGVLRDYKGTDDLAQALRILVDRGERVHLTVAGEPWERELLKPLSTLGEHCTIHEGYIEDDTLHQLIADCDLVCLPYRRISASGPITLVLGAGKAMVATRLPPIVEVLEGYEGGVLAEPDDPVALAEAILQARSLCGREYPAPFDWEAASERYLRLLDGRHSKEGEVGQGENNHHGLEVFATKNSEA